MIYITIPRLREENGERLNWYIKTKQIFDIAISAQMQARMHIFADIHFTVKSDK